MSDSATDSEPIHVGGGTVRLRGAGGSPRAGRPRARPLKYGRWRALALGSVYLLIGVHIAHWKLSGSTLAPLELNEVMYTLEAGVVTAGFLLMATLIAATAFVGRFFCSWACHILALEDLCSWLLQQARIRVRPVRSRLLLLVPPLALFYMFVWPQILRIREGRPAPALRILGDEDGWASFVTTDFWRNLPDPWIAGLTFVVCGFAVVYFLGSRSFCMHACPYGAVFAVMDRLAPGRIKLTGHCEQCGICTSLCASSVRVHEEIARFGKVVDSQCMKDLDCVSACPQEALSFGFTRPAGFASFSKTGRRRQKYDFSLGEESLMAVTFLAVLIVFRGLYDAVPFLMTLGLAGIVSFLTLLVVRLMRRPDLRLIPFRLKRAGKLTGSGRVFVAAAAAFGLLFAHSAYIRYHETRGQRAFDSLALAQERDEASLPIEPLQAAVHHLTLARNRGLFRPSLRDQQLASLHLKGEDPSLAEPYLRRVVREDPRDMDSRLALAQLLLHAGRFEEAATEVETTLDGPPPGPPGAHALLVTIRVAQGQFLAESGRYVEAAAAFGQAVALQPDLVVARFNLAASLDEAGEAAAAGQAYEATLRLVPDDVPTLVNLGLLRAREGDLVAAAAALRRAVELQPDLARAHFNLATIHRRLGDATRAEAHYRRAAELDPLYAEKVRRLVSG